MRSKFFLGASGLMLMNILSGCSESPSLGSPTPSDGVTINGEDLQLNQRLGMYPRIIANCRIGNNTFELELPPSNVLDTVAAYISSVIRENGQHWKKLEPSVIGSIYRKCLEPELIERVTKSEAENEK